MKAIFLFIMNLMRLIMQAASKRTVHTQNAESQGVVYPFETHLAKKQAERRAIQDRMLQRTEKISAGQPQKRLRPHPDAEWRTWRENRRRLYRSSA
ncbi:hypothetical protein KP806_14590 [Paenibacillus sp. N4]|uniref:hypothetical protein n=1 Tax=Paenibacillus vietnamensis TaxID=2590547 RepID=UPI001CD08173|nr:hypothetical protein [Paenibacillus vietnamensis]MCA0756281.1 hypothetical protein [Paenibacillus vietnamensis]